MYLQFLITMIDSASSHTTELLSRATREGIGISLVNNQLVVRFLKKNPVDHRLLDELKQHKQALIDHLARLEEALISVTDPPAYAIQEGDQTYYQVSYWNAFWANDDKKAYKDQIFSLIHLSMRGELRVDALQAAVEYVVERHESLRATFHPLRGKYYMRVASPADTGEYYRFFPLDEVATDPAAILATHFQFENHRFDVQRGPLFLVRLLQTEPTHFLLAIKMHHIVYDGWSIEIVLRDLYVAYEALVNGQPPPLPPLRYQYKDYMRMQNEFLEQNRLAHQAAWAARYSRIPEELVISAPNAGPTSGNRVGKKEVFTLSKSAAVSLTGVAKASAVSLFVVLQAAFKRWLFHRTRQADLVISTLVFGRHDLPDCENQVGLYSQLRYIRTVVSPDDSVADLVVKVKRANEEAEAYKAFPYLEVLASQQPEPNAMNRFWKFHVQYTDLSGFYLSKEDFREVASLQIERMQPQKDVGSTTFPTDIDMNLEFFNLKDCVELHVIYDCTLYSSTFVRAWYEDLIKYLDTV